MYASWLQNKKSLIEVAKSIDFGQSWSTVIANSTNAGTDKDILAVRGNDVYVAYDHAQVVWCSSSHDGGQTWSSVKINANAHSDGLSPPVVPSILLVTFISPGTATHKMAEPTVR